MSALPCVHSMSADSHAAERGREEAREAAVEARIEDLKRDMWQDLEYLSDAIDDAVYKLGNYRKGKVCHPLTVTWLTLLRDGSDDLELARMFRAAAKDYIADKASDQAEEEYSE